MELPATNALAAGDLNGALSDQPPGTVLIVAQARPDWYGVATNRIAAQLTAVLGLRQSVQVIRFDAEPVLQQEQTIEGAKRDLVVVRPATPLKDAMETGLLALIAIPAPRTMIIVAHDQLYPSILSDDRLWDLARQWQIQVDTIYLGSNNKETGVRRLGRRIRGMFKPDPIRGGSTRQTRSFLRLMADVTSGEVCVANDERTGISAANAIAAQILKAPGPEPKPDTLSGCVPWMAELSENYISPAQ
jgi:hypothetical protein